MTIRGDGVEEQRLSKTGEIRRMSKDERFKVLGVVSRASVRKDKNGKNYWDIALMDEEGVIEGKIWGNSRWWDKSGESQTEVGDPAESPIFSELVGKTLGLAGQVTEFKGQPQYNFSGVYYMNQEKFPPHQFVQRSPIGQDTLEKEFLDLLESCGGQVEAFLRYVFFERKLWDRFKDWPAAVAHHHAYVGGLLEHTVAVARTARSLAGTYSESGYEINVPVAVAGALLHDLGKMDSYRLVPAPEMTVVGTVIDHIVLGYNTFAALARDFGLEERLFLAIGHILVSHHGCREFGSPVLPATPEAMVVSAADELDFRLFCWKNSVEKMEDGKEISDYNVSAQRRFWKWEQGNGA
ncbi:3'-5' exoribonuclease YhaM family protein [Aminivibrio sp.]|uniref:3'-5' exoribonuclease YhaM family protein n=1 Tax=Aminivibrio sp. TaxID=1872489 RepID=UPI00345E347D